MAVVPSRARRSRAAASIPSADCSAVRRRRIQRPVDYSRAPPPPQRKVDPAAATTTLVVVGDSMADWLAYGLEEAFAETPEMAIVRKHRTTSGLIRYDTRRDVEWPQIVKEMIAADKPKLIVMMIGAHDRLAIRERAPTPAPGRNAAAAKQQQQCCDGAAATAGAA